MVGVAYETYESHTHDPNNVKLSKKLLRKKCNQYLTLYKARGERPNSIRIAAGHAKQNEAKFFMKSHLDFSQDDKCHIEVVT